MLNKAVLRSICICCGIGLAAPGLSTAQSVQADTVQLDIQQTEKIFLEKNLALLAQQYNIDASKALIQQAKLWDNPVLNTDQNVYANGKFFQHSTSPTGLPQGEFYVQVQQLIKTAGKRGKEIKLAETNAEISQLQFNDVMRNLRLQLRTDFYTILQLQGNRQLFEQQQQELDKLLQGMEEQYKAGNIARKDLLRVQALELSLSQEITENNKRVEDAEAELKTLLQADSKTYIKPVGDYTTIPTLPNTGPDGLIELAKQNNANYRLQQIQIQLQQQNLALQKALAVPDVTFGPNFDQSGGYAPNYYGLGISLPLPILNRNQGNIKAARWQVKQSEANAAEAEEELKNNVTSAYNKFNLSLQLASGKQQDFYKNYGELFGNVMQSYRQRQLSLLEFIDFFDTYKDTRQRQLQLQLDLQLAKEELNYITGTDIIK